LRHIPVLCYFYSWNFLRFCVWSKLQPAFMHCSNSFVKRCISCHVLKV
jgi:hypothetical protein